jgi:hypothetical protein
MAPEYQPTHLPRSDQGGPVTQRDVDAVMASLQRDVDDATIDALMAYARLSSTPR